ncbi:ATP-binding protein [Verrucomicrobia bacterium]|nr:ATP-binding protein [Verrucomicrobiota bacterium]
MFSWFGGNRSALGTGFSSRLCQELQHRLIPLYVVTGVLYGILALCHPFFIESPAVSKVLTWLAAASMLLCFIVASLIKRFSPKSQLIHLLGVFLAMIMVVNSALHLSLTEDPIQSTNFLLVAIGAGCVLNHFRYWTACLLVAWAGWLIGGAWNFSSSMWTHYGFMLFMASVLSGMLLAIRIRHRVRLEVSRRELEAKAVSLEQSNRALLETERRLVEAQEIAQVGSWQFEIEAKELWWSEEVYRILDWSFPDTSPNWEGCKQLVVQDDLDRFVGEMESLRSKEGKVGIEFGILRSKGERREVFLRGQSHRDASGRVVRLSGTLQDVTEACAQQAEKEILEAQLRRAQRMDALGTLAGGIAHDFNNILFSIMGNAQLAELDVPEEHPARRSLENIVSASKRARDVVRQILTFSQREEVCVEETELSAVVKEVLELLRASMPPSIEILTEFETDCPAIAGDQSQIHQILVNLCSNALEAMKEKGGLLRISVKRVWPDADFTQKFPEMEMGPLVGLRVGDTGVGMGEAAVERIFEPFYTTKTATGGTGLGLAVVHGIVKSHHGATSVRSQLGHGTVFDLFFPVLNESSNPGSTVKSELRHGDGERILLVDDEASVLRAVSELLDRLGYRVTECANPLDCERLLKRFPNRFDLVITDLRMREMLGTELARRLSNIRSGLPIILITGHAQELSQKDLRAYGICCLLQKPASLETLAASVYGALRMGADNSSETNASALELSI